MRCPAGGRRRDAPRRLGARLLTGRRADPAAVPFGSRWTVDAAVLRACWRRSRSSPSFSCCFIVIASSGTDEDSGDSGSSVSQQQTDHGVDHRRRRRRRASVSGNFYTVKTGDTLAGIAEEVGVPVAKLQELNPDARPAGSRLGPEDKNPRVTTAHQAVGRGPRRRAAGRRAGRPRRPSRHPRRAALPRSWWTRAPATQLLRQGRRARQRPIASTTKLMTALLTLERADLDDVFTAAPYSASPVESKIGLMPGERMTVRDLLTALAARERERRRGHARERRRRLAGGASCAR